MFATKENCRSNEKHLPLITKAVPLRSVRNQHGKQCQESCSPCFHLYPLLGKFSENSEACSGNILCGALITIYGNLVIERKVYQMVTARVV